MNFQDLISPIQETEFFNTYYEKKHLHIKRSKTNFYNDVLNIDDLDKVLFSITNSYPDFRVVNHSDDTAQNSKAFTLNGNQIIDSNKFVKAYEQGSTLVMSSMHHKCQKLRAFSNKLESFFKHSFQTNVYLTPEKSQGFSTHFDTHDVFILQVSGSKHWRIYDEPVLLADKTYEFDKETFKPGNVIDEFILEEGDLLYIPRGVVHDAYCTNSHSVHVTTGLLGKTWAVQLAELLMSSTQEYMSLRKFTKSNSFPIVSSTTEIEDLKKTVNTLIDSMVSNDDIEDKFFSNKKSYATGLLKQAISEKHMVSQTKIKLREKENIRVLKHPNSTEIKFYDLQLAMPKDCTPFLDSLLNTQNFVPIEDIDCSLDNSSKVLLAQQLNAIGVLELTH